MYESILNYFNKAVHLTPEEELILIQVLKYRKFRKGQFILHEGEICNYETFITGGLVRLYFVDKLGREHTLMFGKENCWISDVESYINQIPSTLNIRVLEKCEVFQLHHKSREDLFKNIPKIERHFNEIIQQHLIVTLQRVVDSLSLPSKERYLKFLSENNGIDLRIPQRHIASYLGITPQFLSQIRAEFKTKKRLGISSFSTFSRLAS